MNSRMMAQQAYSNVRTTTRTTRGIEYELFGRITHRLRAAAEKGKSDFPALVEALHNNRQMWTMLAIDVANNENGLPKDLRARIFYLAEFTQDYSSKVLSQKISVAPLIEVNAAVMRGLRAGGAAK